MPIPINPSRRNVGLFRKIFKVAVPLISYGEPDITGKKFTARTTASKGMAMSINGRRTLFGGEQEV
jgi:hypothetical protein